MTISANVFDVINLKMELLVEDTKDLIEYYDRKDRFEHLLSSSFALLQEDPFFFLLENNLNMAMTIISELRYNYKEYYDLINVLITDFNKINILNNKKELLDEYYIRERNYRGKLFDKKHEILNSILHDSVFLSQVKDDYFEVDIEYFIATSTYFINRYPIIYQNEQIKNATKTMIDAIKKTNSFRANMLIKKIKKQMNI